jgi:hypothetical protein
VLCPGPLVLCAIELLGEGIFCLVPDLKGKTLAFLIVITSIMMLVMD